MNLPPFYIGQKVVCINDSNQATDCDNAIKGNIYTVIAITFGGQAVELKELNSMDYPGYWAWRFAPIQKQSFPLISYTKIMEKELISAN